MTTQLTRENVASAITVSHHQLMTSFAQQDAVGVATVFAEDGQVLPAYRAAIIGQAAIRAFWQGCIDMGSGKVQREPTEVDLLYETANEVGVYKLYERK